MYNFRGISSTQSLENIYTVKLGVYNICDTSERTQKEYKVEKVQIHESYQSKDPYYDICIITLRNNTDEYLPSCLPSKSNTCRTIYVHMNKTIT